MIKRKQIRDSFEIEVKKMKEGRKKIKIVKKK